MTELLGDIIPTHSQMASARTDTDAGVSSWALTRLLSPRATLRVADVDAYGQVLNVYGSTLRLSASAPEVPWAVYLADRAGMFHLLVFDLDAKGANDAAQAQAEADARRVCELLAGVGIEHVVCASGPDGGRHVWVALAEAIDAAAAATLAHLTKALCPSLDLSPMTNAGAGCVRPPGAPHRNGGHSRVLTGDLGTLTAPTATPAQVRELVEHLAELVEAVEPAAAPDARTPLPVDDHGHLYLPGARRSLPAASAAALEEHAGAGVDASAVLWRVLIGAAAARWRYDDVAALVPTAAGLEHVRTMRDRAARHARPTRGESSAEMTLRRQWKKAVQYVASSARLAGDDPTFDYRAGDVADHVQGVQQRADAAAGRWSARGGPADRRVLDVLCQLALQALDCDLEADTRRLALMAGIGRETARTALLRLAADGWITQTRPTEGTRAARWTIDPQNVIHREGMTGRSQADPRPPGAGAALRSLLLANLTSRLAAARHDVFSPAGALGHRTGNLFSRLSTSPQDLVDLTRISGTTEAQTLRDLERLTRHGLVHARTSGWTRPRDDRRRAAARELGVDGRLAERSRRYRLERELWAWWQAEQNWMNAPRRPDASRRGGYGQLSLLPEVGTNHFGAHPRGLDGRADYRAARSRLEQLVIGPDSPVGDAGLRLAS